MKILEYSLLVKDPKFTTNNTEWPLLCAFMEELYLTFSTISENQTLLSSRTTALAWAGPEFPADKSCSVVIINRWSMNTKRFSVSKATDQQEPSSSFPSIHSRPVKFLGCIINGPLSGRNSSVELADKPLAEMRTIDKSHFPDTQKNYSTCLLLGSSGFF